MDAKIMIIGACILVAIIIIMMLRGNGLPKAIQQAKQIKDIKPIVDEIDRTQNADYKSLFNSAIKTLWDSYERELAVDLAKVFLERHDDAPIAQHWLQTIMSVEGQLCGAKLGEDFIKEHFKEDLANKCGSCCGGSCKGKNCKSCK